MMQRPHPTLVLALAAAVSSCKPDGPPAAVAGPEPQSEPSEPGSAEPAEPSPAAKDARTLWFSAGPGRDAILAREARDHDVAVAKLDALLEQPSLSGDDRGAAQWLRGLEDVRLKRYESAAERFAEARRAAALAPVDVRLRVLEARARLSASQPELALALADGIDAKGTPHEAELCVVLGDARLRTDDFVGARKAYEAYFTAPQSKQRAGVRSKLAKTLVEIGGKAEKKAAVEHYERILLDVPLSDYGDEAASLLPELRKEAGLPKGSVEFRRKVELARTSAMLGGRRYRDAIAAADKIIAKGGGPAEQCRALFLKGSAIFKQRNRARARPVFDRADAACAKAGKAHETTRVKARYQGARGLYAEGKYTRAAKAFEALATEHPKHSYADDAWVLAGESWEEARSEKNARRVYRSALAVEGDMLAEARRRLLVMAFAAGDDAEALELTKTGLAQGPATPKEQAKLQYYRGRALMGLGRAEDATAAWVETVRALPLGYASLQALSRLREQGPDALEAAYKVLDEETAGAKGTGALPQHPAATRALLLARLGLGEEAREELKVAKADGWPAAAVLNDAGLFSEAQRLVANLGTTWRRVPPTGAARTRWEAAYPQAFKNLVVPGEEQHAVPPLLTWAIMQTESRFDPGVTSWAGARGLVQLMPKTAEGLAKGAGIEISDNTELYDPALNLDLGQRYLGNLTARFGGGSGGAALAVPSYNGGAGNVDKWLARRGEWTLDLFIESIPFKETRHYTQSVLGRWMTYRWLYTAGKPDERIPFLPNTTPKRG